MHLQTKYWTEGQINTITRHDQLCFDEIRCVYLSSWKQIFPKFLEQHGSNYGSVNFDRNGQTRFGQTPSHISPWVRPRDLIFKPHIKGIWKVYLNKSKRTH